MERRVRLRITEEREYISSHGEVYDMMIKV